MQEIIPAVAFATFIWKFIDFAKFVVAKDWVPARTQAVAWLVGIGGVFLWAQTQWADSVSFTGISLAKMDTPSLIVAGIGAASAASALYDVKKAVDNTDSAKTPPLVLVPSPAPAPQPVAA